MPLILVIILFLAGGTAAVIFTSPLVEFGDPEPTQQDIANETDPLTSLQSTIASSRWGQTYWATQARAQTWLFDKAKSTCAQLEYKDLPNCGHVHLAAFISQPRPAISEYGGKGGFGKMPTIESPETR